MKKVFLLAAIAFAGLTITSCSSDDDGGSASIEGKWYYSEEGFSAVGQEDLSDYDDHEAGCEKDYIEFVEGGVFRDVDFFNSDCEFDTETSTWTRNGNTLTIGTGTDAVTENIATLSGSTLKITVSETFEGQTFNYVTVYTRE
ncbi:hypothetical protein E0W68_03415 [Flavobacterium salilacus subsp. salilacus]|uniref:lipocalin family protein n=1 Tax=Flavobacterium TaxID=237 RepID=UPI0010751EB1|nr:MULTISPECIES: lipocalin family protein [Flavobacterium]KAF2519410.1 hypothetical protein E0W68_03415 [Flavobacterium salilacus subsp. salilacus]MBE1614698.1 lipocalin family protein [Flavobacterium sp. SaA2.13]